MPVIAIIVLVLGILLILAGLYLIKSNKDKAEKIGNAEEKARNIIDEALKAAETKKREGLLELKEETLRNKNELERESKERRAELQKFEKRVLAKEEALDRKGDSLEKRESQLASREDKLNKRQAEVDALSEKRVQELERISGLTSEQAVHYGSSKEQITLLVQTGTEILPVGGHFPSMIFIAVAVHDGYAVRMYGHDEHVALRLFRIEYRRAGRIDGRSGICRRSHYRRCSIRWTNLNGWQTNRVQIFLRCVAGLCVLAETGQEGAPADKQIGRAHV